MRRTRHRTYQQASLGNFVKLPGGNILNLSHLVWVEASLTDDNQFECTIYLDCDTFALQEGGMIFIGKEAENIYNYFDQIADEIPEDPTIQAHGAMIFKSTCEEPEPLYADPILSDEPVPGSKKQ